MEYCAQLDVRLLTNTVVAMGVVSKQAKSGIAADGVVRCVHCSKAIENIGGLGWRVIDSPPGDSYCSVELKDGKAVLNTHRPAHEPEPLRRGTAVELAARNAVAIREEAERISEARRSEDDLPTRRFDQ
jgi:hypothetical protein